MLKIHDGWFLVHRVDLHNALRATAARDVNGKRIDIKLACRVASVVSQILVLYWPFKTHSIISIVLNTVLSIMGTQDANAGVVTLEDGTVYSGDLVIGADGIHVREAAKSYEKIHPDPLTTCS